MSTFKQHVLKTDRMNASQALLELAALVQASDELNLFESSKLITDQMLKESAKEIVQNASKKILHKSSLHLAKSTGLIEYIFKGAKGLLQMFVAAVKGDKERVKELMKSVTQQHIMDFLVKLDMATLHVLTGPLHFIDAVTGFHIGVDMKKSLESASKTLATALTTVKTVINDKILNVKLQRKMLNNVNRIEMLTPEL